MQAQYPETHAGAGREAENFELHSTGPASLPGCPSPRGPHHSWCCHPHRRSTGPRSRGVPHIWWLQVFTTRVVKDVFPVAATCPIHPQGSFSCLFWPLVQRCQCCGLLRCCRSGMLIQGLGRLTPEWIACLQGTHFAPGQASGIAAP